VKCIRCKGDGTLPQQRPKVRQLGRAFSPPYAGHRIICPDCKGTGKAHRK